MSKQRLSSPSFHVCLVLCRKIPHFLGLSPTYIDCKVTGGAVSSLGVCHSGRWMLQSDVAQLHTTRQPDHHLALVTLKSPAVSREHIWLQGGGQIFRTTGLSNCGPSPASWALVLVGPSISLTLSRAHPELHPGLQSLAVPESVSCSVVSNSVTPWSSQPGSSVHGILRARK